MGTAIVWLRNILRIHDNPLLDWACASDEIDSVIPLVLLDPARGIGEEGGLSPNRMRFLYDSIVDLGDRLESEYSAGLMVLHGKPKKAIPLIAEELGPGAWLLCDYRPEPESRHEVSDIQASLSAMGVQSKVFPSVGTSLDVEDVIGS